MTRVYRVTLQSLLRGKLFWICFICSLIFLAEYAFTTDWEAVVTAEHGDWSLHKLMFNSAVMPGRNALFLFISIITSVDLMRDKKHGFSDVVRASRLSPGKVLFAKLGAYLTLGFLVWCASTAGYWAIYYSQTLGRMSVVYYDDAFEVIWMVLQRVVVISIPALLVYLSIAACVTVYTGRSLFGILAGLVVSNLNMIPGILMKAEEAKTSFWDIYNYFGQYVYPVTGANTDFWYFRHIKRASEELGWYREHPHTDRDLIISLAWAFGISAVLLVAAWIRFRKHRD